MLDRKLRQKIEQAFYNYKSNLEYGAAKIVEVAERGLTAKYESVGGSSGGGNPTESKAMMAMQDNATVSWCYVVEKTIEHFNKTGKDTLIRLKYFDKLKERDICERLYLERSAYFDWVNDLITYATMIALQIGVIKLF